MRYLFLCLALLPFLARGQDAKVSALPADTVVQGTDLLYIIDQGTTSKKMTFTTVLDTINGLDDQVREELADSAAQLRSEIGGDAAWSKTSTRVKLTSNNDSLGIGGTSSSARLYVNGKVRTTGNLETTDSLKLVGPYNTYIAKIYPTGDDLYFYDANAGAISLSTLKAGALFGLTSTTRFTLDANENWHFGSNTASSYKFKVTGSIYSTDNIYAEDYLRLGASGNSWIRPSTDYATGGIDFGHASSSRYGAIGFTSSKIFLDGFDWLTLVQQTATPTIQAGLIFLDDDGNFVGSPDGAAWDTLNGNGGGGGSGVVDTTGLPVANQVTYFTAANKIGGNNNLRFDGDSIWFMFPGDADVWFTQSVTGALDTAHISNAGFIFKKGYFKSLQKLLSDKKKIGQYDEIQWTYIEDKTKLIKSQYGIQGLSPTEVASAFQGAIESSFIYENNTKNLLKFTLIMLGILFLWIIRLQLKILKFKNKSV